MCGRDVAVVLDWNQMQRNNALKPRYRVSRHAPPGAPRGARLVCGGSGIAIEPVISTA